MVEYWEKNSGINIPTGNKYVDDWDSKDIWNNIKDKVAKGWFVPSKEEWAAFAGELKIGQTSSDDKNYSKLGLRNFYWSSSQTSDYGSAWCAYFLNGSVSDLGDNYGSYVRLGTTF